MVYIVLDLEFTVIKNRRYLAEIIEIGAIKIREKNKKLEIVDMFQSFVKPKNKKITLITTEFTGISQENINLAPKLTKVIHRFKNWLGDEEYYLISWGPDDKIQLKKQCIDYKLPIDWLKNFNDLQKTISKKIDQSHSQQIGLNKALEYFNIPFEGRPHRAIHDAYNTAKIFINTYSDLILEKNNITDENNYILKKVFQTGEEAFYPFEGLKELLGEPV